MRDRAALGNRNGRAVSLGRAARRFALEPEAAEAFAAPTVAMAETNTARAKDRRTVDMQVMREWVEPGSRVLDLGCGRGVLLDYLKLSLDVEAVGVDLDGEKARACVRRGLNVYMGDMMAFMAAFPDQHFDYVICSRTVQELSDPGAAIREALRVGRHLLVGFVNFGYWRNRLAMLTRGRRIENEVYPTPWWESRPTNPLSLAQFEDFCEREGVVVGRKRLFAGDWRSPVAALPNWFCGYAIYDLSGFKAAPPAGAAKG